MKEKDKDVCEEFIFNTKKVNSISKKIDKEVYLTELSDVFKILGDKTRLKIIYALSCSELCVCDLTKILNISISAVSHQLRILRNLRLVKYRKQGRMVFYSLDDEHILKLFDQGMEHVREK
ncbi:MAG: helix-turn-helix transcriptional regulator [Actinomycetia bacterium]|nr:helix-turn-helix transcriptional regulator [Actinomycetes bacterium]